MWRRYAACAFLCLSGAVLATCRRAPPPSDAAPAVIRVVTWNIHGSAGGLDNIIALLRDCRADIICLQEAHAPSGASGSALNQPGEIATALGFHVYSAGSQLSEGVEQQMAILARWPLQQGEPLDAETGRIYGVTAVIETPAWSLRVFSLHLTSTYRAEVGHALQSSAARLAEASDLLRRVDAAAGPVIVAGDFNSWPGMPAYELLLKRLRTAAEPAPTFPNEQPVLQLDHILLDGLIEARAGEVIATPHSDHLPILAQVTPHPGPREDRR